MAKTKAQVEKIFQPEKYKLSNVVRTVQMRRCWWVVFDVDGYAPADAQVVACATKDLAECVREVYEANRTKKVFLIRAADQGELKGDKDFLLDGKIISTDFANHSVEGYNWSCAYKVEEGEAEDKDIHHQPGRFRTTRRQLW